MDRLGRALVVTETHVPEEGYSAEEMARVLSCYHRITRYNPLELHIFIVCTNNPEIR